jgi:hypothetical protein
MSTVKTDAITAVSTNGDLSLDGIGTGGVSIASTLKMNKGGDISSASPLVIDTDGNYFDVTGTTNFAAMTVEDGNFFMLQFDGALTITHGSGIELPGAANLTTAAGDRLICYATAANTVEVMSVETEAAASSGFTQGTEVATTSGTSVTLASSFTSAPSMIIVSFEGVSTSTTADYFHVVLGDAGGLETTGYTSTSAFANNGGSVNINSDTDGFAVYNSTAGDVCSGLMILSLKDSTNNTWISNHVINGTATSILFGSGSKSLSAVITQMAMTIPSGAYDAGSVNIMYQ